MLQNCNALISASRDCMRLCSVALAAAEASTYGIDSLVYSISLQTAIASAELLTIRFRSNFDNNNRLKMNALYSPST